MPLLHSGTQRKRKDFTSDVSSNAILMRHQMQNFVGKIMVVVVFGPSLKEKTYTTTTEIFFFVGELSGLKKKVFQAGGGCKALSFFLRTGKPYLPPKSFLCCGPHSFGKDRESANRALVIAL